ncbi:MAG: VCBS repeat-containing protein [Deltaproteobacteria bacterium]|nr:VCBS repeat-containing protein [Deltaproteobacteria bacterium]
MGTGTGKQVCRAGLAFVILAVLSCGLASTGVSADYPRRVAIAPFVSLSQDNIASTVAVLPRLLSSRLMAQAGAEVLLLASGEKSPAEQARGAGVPLLIQGTVTKLGKGYSVDVTALDLETGKTAGAFFTAASTEDEIIPQIGFLAGEISEKLFGIKTAVRPSAVQPAVAAPAAPSPPVSPAGPSAGPSVAPLAAAPAAPSGPWEPRSIVKVAFSDKISDEIFRVSSGDVDGDGNPEVAAIGSRKLWVYKVSGDTVAPFRKHEWNNSHLFLSVETVDIDGDGRAEIVVTDLVGDRVNSFVLKYKGDVLEPVAQEIPFYIISLEDGKGGRRLAGQRRGISEPFLREITYLKWDGKTLVPDGDVPVKVAAGIFGLAAFPGDAENRFLYIDEDEHLRILNPNGKTAYKTKEYYSGAVHLFTWGTETRSNIGPDRHYIRGRIVPVTTEGKSPLFLIRQSKGNVLFRDTRTFEWSRLLYVSWAGDGFAEKGASDRIDNLMTDFTVLGSGRPGPGTRVAVTTIESNASYASGAVSRIQLYRMD